ncbi:DUF3558 domain-containing protein [Allokutzneria sp. A3M-2-11 16]|uniref:DUF3558 domain-containing protein n=1 Tax=Allokutzneria sp. A3M-2-11 16 TaxID=2962043 RepID=UPI0020B7042A|nr:DUF3558 domain-containing protein [Allokutzneria sp. A3M-2-11 16]MCP3799253.1 DUF3558 domain-containing protein [Allokutzneria sp. A3M-2-11 16]
MSRDSAGARVADRTARRRLTALGVGLLALPLVSCVNVVGSDTPATTTPTTPAVQRPRVLSMADVDPCTLLTPEQQRTFGIDQPSRPDDSVVLNAKSCRFPNEALSTSVSFIPIPHTGIDRFAAGEVRGEVRDLSIGGFPAKENFVPVKPNLPPWCDVVVDVAPGQALNARYSKNGTTKPPFLTRDELCKRAAEAAEAAIATLMNKG